MGLSPESQTREPSVGEIGPDNQVVPVKYPHRNSRYSPRGTPGTESERVLFPRSERRQERPTTSKGRSLFPAMALAAAGGAPPAYFPDPLQIARLAMSGVPPPPRFLCLLRARRAPP